MAMSQKDQSLSSSQRKDIMVGDEQLIIHLWRSKTDQSGKGKLIVLGQCSIKEICSFAAVWDYLHFRGEEDGGFLRLQDKSPLMRHQFWKITSQTLHKTGIQGWHFGAHSF